jgi:multidrug efflux system membrane fusion protein
VTNERFQALWKANKAAVSERELDQNQALEEQAGAKLMLARVQLESAHLHLDWTKVASPIDGRIGRCSLTAGNLVHKDVTQLTTVLSMDPMYVYFDMDERTYLGMRRIANKAKAKQGDVPLTMGLADEDGYPHQGTVNFVDNHVHATTGSIALRGVFANPKSANGSSLLVPGMFARVRLPISQPYAALLVVDRAVVSDQGVKFVYVVDAGNKVQLRQVTVGRLEPDGQRVIQNGLKTDDRVVVGGLQLVRANLQVQPDLVPMPTLVPLKKEAK